MLLWFGLFVSVGVYLFRTYQGCLVIGGVSRTLSGGMTRVENYPKLCFGALASSHLGGRIHFHPNVSPSDGCEAKRVFQPLL